MTSARGPIIALSKSQQKLLLIYCEDVFSGDILYKSSPLGTIVLGPRTTLMNNGTLNEPSSVKANFVDGLEVLASGDGQLSSVRMIFPHGSGQLAQSSPAGTSPTSTSIFNLFSGLRIRDSPLLGDLNSEENDGLVSL